jgi:hypothetical protein
MEKAVLKYSRLSSWQSTSKESGSSAWIISWTLMLYSCIRVWKTTTASRSVKETGLKTCSRNTCNSKSTFQYPGTKRNKSNNQGQTWDACFSGSGKSELIHEHLEQQKEEWWLAFIKILLDLLNLLIHFIQKVCYRSPSPISPTSKSLVTTFFLYFC